MPFCVPPGQPIATALIPFKSSTTKLLSSSLLFVVDFYPFNGFSLFIPSQRIDNQLVALSSITRLEPIATVLGRPVTGLGRPATVLEPTVTVLEMSSLPFWLPFFPKKLYLPPTGKDPSHLVIIPKRERVRAVSPIFFSQKGYNWEIFGLYPRVSSKRVIIGAEKSEGKANEGRAGGKRTGLPSILVIEEVR